MSATRTKLHDAEATARPDESSQLSAATEVSEAADQATEPKAEPTGPKKIAVVMAHPDDAEFGCGGSIAKWAAAGHEVQLVLLTSGDQGSDDLDMTPERLVAIREKEQLAACAALGIGEPIFLRLPDGLLVADLATRALLVRVLRQLRPDVVVCQDPSVRWVEQVYINHPDHRAAGLVTLEAVFPGVGNPMAYRELRKEGLDAWKIREVYLAGTTDPDVWVDITDTIETKLNALRAHASQLGDWDPDEEIRKWGKADAERHPGVGEYAESFKYFKLE